MSIRYYITIPFFTFIVYFKINAQPRDSINYSFSHTDTSYTFTGRFISDAPVGCLLEICFKYDHISKLAPEEMIVLLNNEGENWNEVTYIFSKYQVFKNTSVWHRTLSNEDQKVDFTLLSSTNSNSILPEMLSSWGHYQVYPNQDKNTLEYYQVCVLSSGIITEIYLETAKRDAIDFLHSFYEYTVRTCITNESHH